MLQSHNTSRFLETKVFLFFIIFFCLAFQALSYFTLWTETELYPVHSSQYLFSRYGSEFLFALKPLFYFLLKISFSLSILLDGLPLTTARFLFAFNGLAVLALMYFYIKHKTSRYNAILAVLFLASLNIFLDRGFRVRSDLLSASLCLAGLLINLNIKTPKDWKLYIMISLLALVLLASPKGIYWFCFSSILIWHDMKIKPDTWLVFKTAVLCCLSFYLISLLFQDPLFIESLYQSAQFYLLNLSGAYYSILKSSWWTYLHQISHVGIFINKNPFLMLIIILKFLFMLGSLFLLKNRKRDLSDLYFIILILVLFFHPQQKLFFLSALSPFFCIAFFTDSQWKRVLTQSYSKTFKIFLLGFWLIYAFAYTSYFSYKIYMQKNNLHQKTAVKELNTFYKELDSSLSVFDPGCLIYTRKTLCKYILYNDSFQTNFHSYLDDNNFDIIFSSYLVSSLKLLTYNKSQFGYVNIKNYIYYKAFLIDKPAYFIAEKGDSYTGLKTPPALRDSPPRGKNNQVSAPSGLKQHEPPASGKLIKPKPNYNQILNDPSKLANLTLNNSLSQKNSLQKQQLLSGEKILENFSSLNQVKVSKQKRKYFYLYIDRLNRPLNKNIKCKNKSSFILQEGCYYNENQIRESFIPLTNKRIALFYAPFPFDIQSEKSLRILLRYDRF